MSNWPRKYFHLFPNRLEWRGEQAGVSESIFLQFDSPGNVTSFRGHIAWSYHLIKSSGGIF